MDKLSKIDADFAKVKKRLGPTTGVSKGVKPLPKPKVRLKGTDPRKGEYALTIKKKL